MHYSMYSQFSELLKRVGPEAAADQVKAMVFASAEPWLTWKLLAVSVRSLKTAACIFPAIRCIPICTKRKKTFS